MEIVYTHCAGLDVHKKAVVAVLNGPGETGGLYEEDLGMRMMDCPYFIVNGR